MIWFFFWVHVLIGSVGIGNREGSHTRTIFHKAPMHLWAHFSVMITQVILQTIVWPHIRGKPGDMMMVVRTFVLLYDEAT